MCIYRAALSQIWWSCNFRHLVLPLGRGLLYKGTKSLILEPSHIHLTEIYKDFSTCASEELNESFLHSGLVFVCIFDDRTEVVYFDGYKSGSDGSLSYVEVNKGGLSGEGFVLVENTVPQTVENMSAFCSVAVLPYVGMVAHNGRGSGLGEFVGQQPLLLVSLLPVFCAPVRYHHNNVVRMGRLVGGNGFNQLLGRGVADAAFAFPVVPAREAQQRDAE